jgi:hypothetical protein
VVPAETHFERDVEYVFHIRRNDLVCKETLFVADEYPEQTATYATRSMSTGTRLRESHYRYTHTKNAGKPVQMPHV